MQDSKEHQSAGRETPFVLPLPIDREHLGRPLGARGRGTSWRPVFSYPPPRPSDSRQRRGAPWNLFSQLRCPPFVGLHVPTRPGLGLLSLSGFLHLGTSWAACGQLCLVARTFRNAPF